MGRKDGRAAVPVSRTAGTPSNTMCRGPRSTSVPSGVFIHQAVWPQLTWAKNWLVVGVPSVLAVAESPSYTKSPGPRSTSIPSVILVHRVVWPQRTLYENWGLCPFRGGEARSPSSTKFPGLRPTPIPSGIVMHPTVLAQ